MASDIPMGCLNLSWNHIAVDSSSCPTLLLSLSLSTASDLHPNLKVPTLSCSFPNTSLALLFLSLTSVSQKTLTNISGLREQVVRQRIGTGQRKHCLK